MLAKSLARSKGGSKGGSPLERQASAPQSMPTVRESASLRTDDASGSSSEGGTTPLQPLDRRPSVEDTAATAKRKASNGGSRPSTAYHPADRPIDRPNGMPPIATSSSGSSELPQPQQQQEPHSGSSANAPKPPDETDGFAGVAVSKPQVGHTAELVQCCQGGSRVDCCSVRVTTLQSDRIITQ